MIPSQKILNIPVTCLPFEEQVMLILRWAKIRASKFVCLANVHTLIEANKKPLFSGVLHKADLVTPDGKPLVLMLRKLGIKHQNQVAGMDVFLNLCNLAEQSGVSVYFLGSTENVLDKIKQKLNREYPLLKVAGMKSIPFVSIEEVLAKRDNELIAEINCSGAGIIFVCLGCPKQEIWMSKHQGLINGVMIGVGAVFSMYADINPRAPYWMQKVYLEWLYRFLQEPSRLWKRYSSTIPPFLYLAMKQLLFPGKDKLSKLELQPSIERNMVVNIETLDFSPEKLGQILIRQNVITEHDLKKALLNQQSNPNLKLGEILINSGVISLPQLKFYLYNQHIKLGEILVERKYLKSRSLKKILLTQKNNGKKMGKILLEQNILSKQQLNKILINQYSRRKGLYLIDVQKKEKSTWLLMKDNFATK